MTINFYENSTGLWILRQTNSSCVNGTYRWIFSQASSASTKYYWKVYANDGLHNVSQWYCFTTEAGGATITVAVSPTSWNGGTPALGTNIQNNFTLWQNGSATIDITIGINNTNYTFVTYSNWLTNGHNRYCANYTTNTWSTETSITPGYPPSSVLKGSFAPGHFHFGIRLWLPRTVTYANIREDFKIVLTISEST
jgi:hypothetical protein